MAEPQQNRYISDINDWLNGGKLQNYEKLVGLLLIVIRSFIDWDSHGISNMQVKDRIRQRKIAIEDQTGRINVNDCLIFKRTNKLASVLQALVDINENNNQLSPAALGGTITFLSSWLYENELLIVDFVRRPTSQSTETTSLTNLLFISCILLACLQGKLEYKIYSPQELMLLIIGYCVKADTLDWRRAIDEAQQIHSHAWVDLMKGIEKKGINVRDCYQNLLQMLNKAQGGSQDVRFIDAALALDILEDFEQDGWMLNPIEDIGSSASQEWLTACEVYDALYKHFKIERKYFRQSIIG